MKYVLYAFGGFSLGAVLASLLLIAIAYSQSVRVHWTAREHYIQYHHTAIQLVKR